MSSAPVTVAQPQCNGYCLPLYIYGGITALSLGAQFIWSPTTFGERLWNLITSSFWALLYGLIIFYFCKTCQTVPAYLLLIPPSIWFGLQMLFLLVRRPMVVTSAVRT